MATKFPQQTRLFIVGCPRSGTTLLQSLIAAHPEATSFTESKFFDCLYPSGAGPFHNFGLASWVPRLRQFMFQINNGFTPKRPPVGAFTPAQLTQHFVKVLDGMSRARGAQAWVEKTPSNLRHIGFITKHVEGAKFIHILREGKDTVASLYDVRSKYPEAWHDQAASIAQSIARWQRDINASLEYAELENHLIVRYENLTDRPEETLRQICDFAGLNYDPLMLRNYPEAAKQVTRHHEVWKLGVQGPIANANGNKFYRLFTREQQAHILRQTQDLSNRISDRHAVDGARAGRG